VVRYYAEVNEEAVESGIQSHHRADDVKSLEISFSFPHRPSLPFCCCCMLIGRVAMLDWNPSTYRSVVVTGGPGVDLSSFGFLTVYFNFGSRGQLTIAGGIS
jgi:hypothetical protein